MAGQVLYYSAVGVHIHTVFGQSNMHVKTMETESMSIYILTAIPKTITQLQTKDVEEVASHVDTCMH